MENKKMTFMKMFFLNMTFGIFSLTFVLSKLIAQSDFLSKSFFTLFFFYFCVLIIYALLWQQVLKHMELSIAYLNKGIVILWSLLWSIVIFNDKIKVQSVLGIIIIMIGISMVNYYDQ